MSFPCVRTQRLFAWVSIVWFTSVVSIVGGQVVELKVTPRVTAECGKNVTLTCNASSSRPLDIKLFSWLAGAKTMCQYGGQQADPEVVCENTSGVSHKTLTLTLINVMPVNSKSYLCKLQATQGSKAGSTSVTVQDCLEGSDFVTDKSHAKCWFTGVYPRGTVHWFQGDVNLTDSASTHEEEDQHGRYNVSSEINVEGGNLSAPYNCLLWVPSDGKYLSSQQLMIRSSSGNMVKLQWICIVVEIMMLKCMT